MNKRYLTVASALLAVLLVTGPALSAEKAAPTPAKEMMMKQKGPMSAQANPMQAKMRDAMMKSREANKETLDQIQAKKKEMLEIVKAEKFDKSAYLAKHEEIQTLMHKVANARMQAKADVLATMTAQERASMPMGGGHRMGMMGGKGKGSMMGKCDKPEDCPMKSGMGQGMGGPAGMMGGAMSMQEEAEPNGNE